MPPEAAARPDDPRAWLALAHEDLALARSNVPGVGFGLRCFHAQQAAEKAIKAVLLARAVTFPYVHDLGRLLDLLRAGGLAVPDDVSEADTLTDYATLARYPGNGEIDADDLSHALSTAHAVLEWAEQAL